MTRAKEISVRDDRQSAFLYGELDGDTGYCVINRPEAQNAMSREMWLELPETLERLRTKGARVIVIRGEGTAFCAGADLNDLKTIETREDAEFQWMPIKNALDFLSGFDLPTIAIIQGACLGGGCLLAVACDLRYAAPTAFFAVPVARLGIALDDANILRLVMLVGTGAAKELLFTASTISSLEAEQIGLVNRVFETNKLIEEVSGRALRIIENGSGSIKESKNSLERIKAAILSINEKLPLDCQDAVIDSYVSEDFKSRI